MLDDFDKGTIPLDMEEQLTKTEIMLNSFFKTTSRDIKKLYYKCTYKEDSIRYRLMSIKRIAGKDREIAFSLESAGMKTLLNLLPSMLVSVYGTVAIIDEFEIGLHDLLVKEIILALHASIKGQLILTTHNTNLMNSGLPKECFYIINEKNDGYRSVNPITCNHKIHKNTSIQNQYLTGQYTGIPDIRSLDFLSLLNDLGMKY